MPDPEPLHTYRSDDGLLHLAEPDAAVFRCGQPVSGERVLTTGTIPGRSCRSCYRD